ncbi:LuxR C-terminal-related transcriptional regulator [Nonomuraea jabiensis]|uniref:LuxR C-terminal-related transcriptional regulator n=1 Tax=Nonomuraea jabiensis TaxID=882448 RepID=UPI003D75EA87
MDRKSLRSVTFTPSLSGAFIADTAADRPQLSQREVEVLRAWFVSSSKELVAAKLNITAKTVDTYIARVRMKYANVGRAARTKSELVGCGQAADTTARGSGYSFARGRT